jgi:tyrosine-protein kinase
MQTPGWAPAPPPDGSFFDLHDYVQVVKRRWKLILLITTVAVLLSIVYTSLQPSVYTATSEVLVREPLAGATVPLSTQPLNVENERQIMLSFPVATLVAERLELDESPQRLLQRIEVTIPKDADVLQVRFQHTVPQIAAQGAQAFTQAYLDYKTQQAQQMLDERTTAINGKIQDLEDAGASQAVIAPFNQALLAIQSTTVDPGQILVDAQTPGAPTSPNLALNIVLALLAGLFVGLVAAFVRERLDDRLRGRSDLEETINAPVMTMIPTVPTWRERSAPYLVTLEAPRSPAAEAYRTLRTSILVGAAHAGIKSIMVVSAVAGEGKTTTASNLAITLAQADKRVVLISADLRRPRLHEFFGLGSAERGLSEVLEGDRRAWESMRSGKVDNLWIMSSGKQSQQPTELLQSEAMRELLIDQREVVDFILLDCPPVLAVADALVLAPMVDAVIYVADAKSTPRGAVLQARAQLDQVGARILGAVLNEVEATTGYAYYGQYAYAGERDGQPTGNGKAAARDQLRKERFPG